MKKKQRKKEWEKGRVKMYIVILLELEYISVALINKIIIVIKSSTRFFL
jgi:hypothetical protein